MENVVVSVRESIAFGSATLFATMSDGTEKQLFSYYIDELFFRKSEFIGKTIRECSAIRQAKDIDYLRS